MNKILAFVFPAFVIITMLVALVVPPVSTELGYVELPNLSNWVRNTNSAFRNYSFKIPNIPQVTFSNLSSTITGEGVKYLVRVLKDFVNFFVGIGNFIVLILNAVFGILQWVGIAIYCATDFFDMLKTTYSA